MHINEMSAADMDRIEKLWTSPEPRAEDGKPRVRGGDFYREVWLAEKKAETENTLTRWLVIWTAVLSIATIVLVVVTAVRG